tara:strand:- start:1349 stop:1852 length:504 start_codon:yes stop_codon:yes gene_type:complete
MKIKSYPLHIVSLAEHDFEYDLFVAMELTDTNPDMDKLAPKVMTSRHLQKQSFPFIWYGEYLESLSVTQSYKDWTKTLSHAHQKLLYTQTEYKGANFNQYIKVNEKDLIFTSPIQILVFMQHNNLHNLAIGGLHIVGCVNDFNNELQVLCEQHDYKINCYVIKEYSL